MDTEFSTLPAPAIEDITQFNPAIMIENISASPSLLWLLFLGIVVISAIASIILSYHWIRYAVRDPRMYVMQILYYAVGVGLLGIIMSLIISLS